MKTENRVLKDIIWGHKNKASKILKLKTGKITRKPQRKETDHKKKEKKNAGNI